MTYVSSLAVSPFCSHQASITTKQSNGDVSGYCKKHGHVILLPYYHTYANKFVARDATWACPGCLIELNHLDLGAAVPRSIVSCTVCGEKDATVDCDICGKVVCAKHRIEGVCDSCSKGLSGS